MALGMFIQTLGEAPEVMVVWVGLVRVNGMGEGMGNVVLTIEMEMEIVCMLVGVLKVREGRLGTGTEEEGWMQEGRGEQGSAME